MMDGEQIECYRINYDVEYWKNVVEKVGNHCSSPFGAVLAVNALCDEVDRLNEKLQVAEDCLCEYESREIDSGNLRGGLAAVTLTKLNGG